MKISVIVPTYKPQAYLWECLGSLCRQSFDKSAFEIILILNGCKEPYYAQIKEYISANMSGCNVVLLQTDTGGVSNARNIGLDIAKGEYITFIDDDDYVSESFLEELYDKASVDTISLCKPIAFTENVNTSQPYPITDVFNKLSASPMSHFTRVRKYFSGPWMKLIHRDVIGSRRFDTRFVNGEDSLFMFLISDRLRNVSFTSASAVYYRRYRAGSAVTTQKPFGYWFKNCMKMIGAYLHIYFSEPTQYNFCFFITRLMAVGHTLVNQLKK